MKKFLAVCAVALLAGAGARAQQFSLYYSNTLFDAFNNPSRELFQDTCKKWASNLFIPALSLDATFKGPAKRIPASMIYSRQMNFYKLENGDKRTNELDINADITLLMMRFRVSKKRHDEVSLGFQIRSQNQFTVKNEFFNLFKGNNTYAGERLNGVFDMDTYFTNYTSASIGYRSKIYGKLSGGFRYSLLNGIINQGLKVEDSYIFTEENGEYIEVGLKGTYSSSERIVQLYEDPPQSELQTAMNDDFANDLLSDFIKRKNKGYALNLGVDYQIDDRWIATAAAKDIGRIKWNDEHSIRYILNKSIRFEGIPATESQSVQDSILNNLSAFAVDSIVGSYKTALPTRLELSTQYKVTNWYRPALIVSNEIGSGAVDFTILNDLILLKRLHFITAFGFSTNGFFNLGGQLLLNTKWLDWYIGSEKLLNTYMIANYSNYYMPVAADIMTGMAFKFGHCPKIKEDKTKDTDLDGLADLLDKCPTIAGPRENGGCPYTDTDNDGVIDSLDKCPTVAGVRENDGCPYSDTDGDGLLDKDDMCPTVPGPVENKGCPYSDTDNDGVLDTLDKCPTLAGPLGNNGCPYPDTDSDSVIDILDKCPTIAGTVANNGCPEEPKKAVLTQAEQEVVNKVFKNLIFETGKAVIKPSSYPALDGLLILLNKKPAFKVLVEGHTDNTGSVSLNNKLSQDRANAVKAYLKTKGIEDMRIIAVGYGPSRPVADNKTPEGRAKNRRVEFTIIE